MGKEEEDGGMHRGSSIWRGNSIVHMAICSMEGIYAWREGVRVGWV